ncbi:hypothetical protein ABUW04_34565 [Streptacidiphilus sp. N1-10]|uniref:Septum formation-related domain-containing protein n=1 Tax=Streptacidiphilus jeojiensis TaxID=3229225 RepID=A0ABV6XYQ1_9ACTN
MSTNRPTARRRTFAVAAGLLALVVAAVLVVVLAGGGHRKAATAPASASPSASPSPSPVPSSPPPPSPSPVPQTLPYLLLRPGDCFDAPGHTGATSRYSRKDCHQPHDGQVIGLLQLPAGLTTGVALVEKANSLCYPVTAPVRARQTVRPLVVGGVIWPDLASYRGGRRTATCAIEHDPAGPQLTAPLR